jgi:hypothetical protein
MAKKKRSDRERMDWLDKQERTTNSPEGWRAVCFESPVIKALSLRFAIDIAMDAEARRKR